MDTYELINEGYELFKAEKFDEAIQKLNEALESIPDETEDIQNQADAQFGLGLCLLEKIRNQKQLSKIKAIFNNILVEQKCCVKNYRMKL